jgi:PKD repeat protein
MVGVNSFAQYLMNNTAGSYTTCGGYFQDSGGGSPYGYNENSFLTFYPSDPNSKLMFNFISVSLEPNQDYLWARDGPIASSPLITSFTGTTGPPNGIVLATNPQGAITFIFSSDNVINWDGWFARISCIPNNATFYTMNSSNIPKIDTVCEGIFVDAGGLMGNYGFNSNAIHTFYPATPNSSVQMDFSFFNTETDYDGLMIYNGPDTTYPLLSSSLPAGLDPFTCPEGSYRGTNMYTTIFQSTDISGALTYVFKSNATVVKPGWLASISCVPNPGTFVFMNDAINTHTLCNASFYDSGSDQNNYNNNENYTQTFIPSTPSSNIKLDFGNINLGAGDTLWVYNGLNTTENILATFTWDSNSINVISTHPTGALTVKFKSDASGTSIGWHAGVSCTPIIVPYITMSNVTSPYSTCFGNFYDSGGPTQPYGNSSVQTLTLLPSTPNYVLQVNFLNFDTQAGYDGFLIYDGPSINSPLISSGQPAGISALNCPAGAFSGSQSPGLITSSDPTGALTFVFRSGTSGTAAGWKATVNCVDPNTVILADFTSNVTQINAGGSVNFSDLSSNNPTSWLWSFPGGTPASSTSQHPSNIVYNTPGCYAVTLTASNAFGNGTHTETCYITVNAVTTPPVASFMANSLSITAGGSVNFTDQSTNNPIIWDWTFNGGTPSTSTFQNPSNIVYNTPGCYTVTLEVWNSFGNDIETQTCYITVNPPNIAPVAAFTANTNSIIAGSNVNFTDQSSNNPSSWLWTFTGGNPSSSTQQNPSNIVYSSPGCYAVTLVATNAFGNDTETQTCYINVTNAPAGCTELFISEYIEGSGNNKALEFYNPSISALDLTGYALELYTNGGTTVSSSYNFTGNLPSHQVFVLANTGANATILAQADATSAVCGFNGNDAIVLKKNGIVIDVIGVVGDNPGGSWAVGSGSTAENTLIRNVSIDGPATSWITSATQWTVYPTGTTTYLGSHTSNCGGVIVAPVASFTSNTQNITTGQSVNFTDLSTNNPTSWSWTFTGGTPASSAAQNPTNITYNTPGCYQVSLTATNSAGSNTSTQTCYITVTNVVITPVANFTASSFNITTGQSVNFTDLSTNNPTSWSWTFTGGTPASSTSQNPTNITYNTPGCYQVSLTATNSAGSNTSTQTCYINVTNPVIAPVANFTASTFNITTGQSVNFTDLSTNNPTSWNWVFTGGTPASSSVQYPTNIVYNTPGCYQVSLTATNSAGSNTSTQTCYINVTNPVIAPVANFTASTFNITTGQSVNFTDLSTNNPTSWNWTFTGGTPASSTVQNPTNIVYNTPGCYQVSLTATNSAGSNTSHKLVILMSPTL